MKYSGVGGQAVMEGVMMKNKDKYAVAVRKPNHEIEVKVSDCKSAIKNEKLRNLPIVRGVVNFIESLSLGMKTLMYSASFLKMRRIRRRKKIFLRKKKRRWRRKKKRRKIADERNIGVFGCFCVASILCASLFSVRIFSQGDCFGDFDCFDRGIDTSGYFCWLHSIDFPDAGY